MPAESNPEIDPYPRPLYPPEVLGIFIESGTHEENRLKELKLLQSQFAEAFKIAVDIDLVNQAITESSRPDLTMQEKATMMQVDNPKEFRDTTSELTAQNFVSLRATDNFLYGIRNITQVENFERWIGVDVRKNPEDLINHNSELYFLILSTHLHKKAFGRMHAIAPDLTMNIVRLCAGTEENKHHTDEIMPELFMAYTLMSMLVDTGDPYVVSNEPGPDAKTPDYKYLCR